MTTDDFLASADFAQFLDETLREAACKAVEVYLGQNPDPRYRAKNNQLRKIPEVIAAEGRQGLVNLARNQKEKNSYRVNKSFWEFVWRILEKPEDSWSLYRVAQQTIEQRKDFFNSLDPQQVKAVMKKGREELIKMALPVYFEHFCCEYLFRRSQE